MLKVSQLLKFVSDLNPQNTPTRLCFYNFIKGYANPEDNLSPELIQQFFNYCLDFPHWVGNKIQLSHEVQFMLNNFNSFYQQEFDLSALRFPETMQLIELENTQDLLATINCHVATLCQPTDKFRTLLDQNKRAICIILKQDGSLEVRTFDRKFTIRDGVLEPLRKDLALFYTANLELKPQCLQKIEVAPYITAQFTIDNGLVSGQMIRGYVFQKLLEMTNESLKDQTKLFFPIKRLEQFFIDRRTDPYYQELTNQLERTSSLTEQGDLEALKWSSIILNKAETALENVYNGDKLLELLIRDLRFTAQAQTPPERDVKSKEHEECLKIVPIKEFDLIN